MVNKNLKISVLFSLLLVTFFSCKKENNSVQLTGVFDWKETSYSGKIITKDTIGKSYTIEFKNNIVNFYENDNLVLEGKLIGKSNSFSCHDHGSDCLSIDKYTILIENNLFEIKKRTYEFKIYQYDNNGNEYTEFYSGNFPFEEERFYLNSDYPYFATSNKFIKRQ